MSQTAQKPAGFGSLPRALLLIAGAVGLAIFAYKGVKPDLWPKRLAEVVPGKVYRSSELSPKAMEDLVRGAHVKTIIDLGVAPDGDPRDRRQQLAAQALGLKRYKFNLIGDATGNPNEYVAALQIALNPDNQPVLIHCATGSQRTSCAIALLRMASEKMPLDQAIAEAEQFDAKPKVGEVLRQISPRVLQAVGSQALIPGEPAVVVAPASPVAAKP